MRLARATALNGAKHYAGRMANIHQIEKEYFNKNIEIFLFEDSLYLIALGTSL